MSDSLCLEGSLRALKQAIKGRKKELEIIHQSDHGIQYCSKEYRKELKKNNIKISMAEKGNCYENAIAERVNGILKTEFLLDKIFVTKLVAKRKILEAVKIYNTQRPHLSLNFSTPEEKHKDAA